jgi:hypothetical protein
VQESRLPHAVCRSHRLPHPNPAKEQRDSAGLAAGEMAIAPHLRECDHW